MKLKDVTSKCQLEVRLVKENSPWPNPKVKIYDSKTSRFIHETNKRGQVVSISTADGRVTEKELIYAITRLMKLDFEDIVLYTSQNGVIYLKEKDVVYYKEANVVH